MILEYKSESMLMHMGRAIMKRKLLDKITFEKLAEEFDLSVRRTKDIVYNGQWKIYKHIPE